MWGQEYNTTTKPHYSYATPPMASLVPRLPCYIRNRNSYTVLSRASGHGQSQLKRQKLRVGGYTEKVLKCFNYPRARAHSGYKVSCQGIPNRLASCFVKASLTVEKAVLCCSLIAKFLQRSVIVCSTRISCRKRRTFRSRPCVQTFYA